MKNNFCHFLQVPFSGLGLWGGFRGNRWLKNRTQIFKQFVIPSLQAQTNKNFILHCCWRREEKTNSLVKELIEYLDAIKEFKTIHTFNGILFYDDKYPDDIARERLIMAIHGSLGELINIIGEVDYVLTTIQPSDDIFHKDMVSNIQKILENPKLQAVGFDRGYICNYLTKEVKNYNPKTNPPFFTIKFPKDIFVEPLKHINYISIKKDVDKYKAGTPYPSHEYLPYALNYGIIRERGFVVGVHQENISTAFDNPYAGEKVNQEVLKDFGIYDVKPLVISFSLRRMIFNKLPHKIKRKLRFWAGEKNWILKQFFAIIYNGLRN